MYYVVTLPYIILYYLLLFGSFWIMDQLYLCVDYDKLH